jgi:DHA2 family multidrug resistance protein
MLRAFSITQSSLDHQAQLWAYVDVFRYLALLCVVCAPAAFLLRRPPKGAKGEAG